MRKKYLFLSTALILSLCGCSNPSEPSPSVPEAPILSLYDANARFVTEGYGQNVSGGNEWYPLATYRHKNNGEAPYVEVGQFLDVLNELIHVKVDFTAMTSERLAKYDSSVKKIAGHHYGIYSESVLGATMDTEENVFDVERFDYMLCQPDTFNGTLRNDIAAPNPGKNSLVHGSVRSQYLGEFKNEVYDLDDYGMDIVENEGKVYMPAQWLSNLFLRGLGVDIVYNGNDFFSSASVGTYSGSPATEGSFRSGNNTFEVNGTLYQLGTALEEEECRYVGAMPEEEGQSQLYGIFSLDKQGHGYHFTASAPNAAYEGEATYQLNWERKDGDLYLTLCAKDALGNFASSGHVMRISSNETYYNKKTRSQELCDFNYQLLRFQFDHLYGLKEELGAKQGYVDFDSFVQAKGLKEKLLSTDSRVYDEGLGQFLMGYVDDGHTKYTDRSVFSGIQEESGKEMATRYLGPRRGAILNKLSEYQNYRQSVLGEGVQAQDLFLEGETAVIRFDSFIHLLPIITDPGSSLDMLPTSALISGSSPFGFLRAFKQLEDHSEIKNVVLDLTCNGGGMVLTLPFLAAYFTKDPTIYLKDNLGGVVREFHYEVDLNLDGVYNGPGDYYGDKYHFYLLTSDMSFSCASAFPTMAHIAGVDVIGMQGGGGACNVAGFTDACGSIYTLSAPQQIGYLDENGNFVNDDEGIPVTHELPKESWYDLARLDEAIRGFSGN